MTQDVPRTNGIAKAASAVDAPRPAAVLRTAQPALPDVCHTLRRKVTAFLDGKSDGRLVRDTQEQVRVAMGVVDEALHRYGYEGKHYALSLHAGTHGTGR